MARFGRILTAMVTPFDDAGELDVDAAVALAKWLVEQGNEGLVVCGTTGEAPTLSIDEKLQLFEAVVNAVTVPVVAGTTGANTLHDIGLTEEAGHLGVAGILVETEYDSNDFPVAPIVGTFDDVFAVPEPSFALLIAFGVLGLASLSVADRSKGCDREAAATY